MRKFHHTTKPGRPEHPRSRAPGAGVSRKVTERRGAQGETWETLLLAFGRCCAYCGASSDGGELTRDHIIPRSQGGPNLLWNYVPACAPCNSQRGSTPIGAWIEARARTRTLSPLTQERVRAAQARWARSAGGRIAARRAAQGGGA